MSDDLNIYQRLLAVQKEAVAPREISGKFGKARSAEQILEAYKPVCNKHGLYLFTTDQLWEVGGRNYVSSTATVVNVDKPDEKHSASAAAWENEVERNKFGAAILDTSQVTGKTSSYAKKYALQNLFAIDDTKDADAHDQDAQAGATKPTEPKRPAVGSTPPPTTDRLATDVQKAQVKAFARALGIKDEDLARELHENYGVKNPAKMTAAEAKEVIEAMK